MKKIQLLICAFLLMSSCLCASADMLTGGLIYNEQDLKDNALKNVVLELPQTVIKNHLVDVNMNENKNSLKAGILYTDRELAMFDLGTAEVYGVCFRNEPKYTYFYWSKNGKLKSVAIDENYAEGTYPKIQYNYNADGKFTHLIIKVSETEAFIYNKAGNLNSHWIGDQAYNKKKRAVGVAYRVRQVD